MGNIGFVSFTIICLQNEKVRHDLNGSSPNDISANIKEL